MMREEWEDEAACAGIPGDIWFPEKNEWRKANEAKLVCNTMCSVREQCLEFAVREGIEFGIFGGLTGRERATMRRRTGAA